jgi:hypothetical protein
LYFRFLVAFKEWRTEMKKQNVMHKFFLFAVLFMVVTGFSLLYAGTEEFDKTMHPILTEYLKIQEVLAGDRTEGVKSAAEKTVTLAGHVDAKTVTGGHKITDLKSSASGRIAGRSIGNKNIVCTG